MLDWANSPHGYWEDIKELITFANVKVMSFFLANNVEIWYNLHIKVSL